jgi:two-component system sensor histidine kinase UhpB
MTERREALGEVQKREALLRGFTDHSPALMSIKDREGRYRFANRQFLEHFGVRADQVLGRTDLELFPRQQGLALAAHDAQVLAERRAVQTEETVSDFEGERTRVVVKFPVLDAAGAVAWVGGIVTDITERKRAEQALREQRTLLAEAQRVAGLGCWEWDPASGRITWSEELYRIYGLDPKRFAPTFEAYLEHVHAEDRQQVGAMVARALMDGRGFHLEERIVRPDGAVRHLRSHGEVLRGEKGQPLKLLCASLDVTEQKHSEAALRAAAASVQALTRRLVEAEEAERRRIARELHDRAGQSLSALNINLDIVLAAAGDALPPELQARLRDSLALVDGTLQAVENVMADLRPPLLDEYGLGAALGWHLEQVARRAGLAIALDDRAKERIREMHAEGAVALFRIAQEALNNVARHAGAKSVRVSLDIQGAAESAFAQLVVADDGRGFTPGPPDPRAPRWGLTTMRERAEAVGGRIEFDSAPGRGTTLRVTAPLGAKR